MLWAMQASPARAAKAGEVRFNRDIRPILSENCFTCHGPDKNRHKGDLRLDMAEDAMAEHHTDGKVTHPVVPGNPGSSELVKRINATDPDEVMPPPKSLRKLGEPEKNLLAEWIKQGAKWEPHWAYIPPVRAKLPKVSDPAWEKNAIDAFILARLDQEGMKPSPQADPHTLIRRVSLDLTGLPPTPEAVEAFVNDARPDAYEKLVDRLLASPQYGDAGRGRGWICAVCGFQRLPATTGFETCGRGATGSSSR